MFFASATTSINPMKVHHFIQLIYFQNRDKQWINRMDEKAEAMAQEERKNWKGLNHKRGGGVGTLLMLCISHEPQVSLTRFEL